MICKPKEWVVGARSEKGGYLLEEFNELNELNEFNQFIKVVSNWFVKGGKNPVIVNNWFIKVKKNMKFALGTQHGGGAGCS